MKKTGELLKKVREEKGLSLHEIGLSLKINPKILKQIEDGEKNNLPAKTFLRGFVQSYANYLKLDSDEVLKIFSEEMGSTKPQNIPMNNSLDAKSNDLTLTDSKEEVGSGTNKASTAAYTKKDFEFKNFGVGILVLLLLLSLFGVRKIVEKYQKESEIETPLAEPSESSDSSPNNPIPNAETKLSESENAGVDQNSADTATIDPAKTNPLVPHAPTNTQPLPAATTTTTTTTTPIVTPPTPSIPVAENPEKPIPSTATVTAAAPAKIPTTTTTAATATTTITTTTPTPAVAAKPKNVEVVIQALDSVDVEVTLSSGKSEVIKLSPSQTQTIKSTAGVKLNFSNGGAVNLIVNGKDIGVPGDLGKPKKVSF